MQANAYNAGKEILHGLPSANMIAISAHDAIRHFGCSPVLTCLSAAHLQTEKQNFTHFAPTQPCKPYSIKR